MLCGVLVCLLAAAPALAASNRVALVIGNADYIDMPLKNPRNDAVAMKQVLEQSGFDVVAALDADLDTMQNAMLDFVARLNRDSTALVFYAGHGMQANGRNYLLPVDAKIETERTLRFASLELGDLLEELEASAARIKIVILDACRNNPFERAMRGSGRGLAAVDAARGTLIAYATSPGATASDGDGDNGLYTQSLLQAIAQPGLKVEEVFKQVRIAVSDASRGSQVPWESSSLTGDFIFIDDTDKPEAATSAAQTVATATPAQVAEPRAIDHEALFWESVQDSQDESMLQAYIDQYPDGHYAFLAKLKIDKLRKASEAASSGGVVKSEAVKKQPIAAIKAPEQPKSAASTCSDLSGRWLNEPANSGLCVPRELTLTKLGDNRYQILGSGCGTALKATARWEDQTTLIADWKMSTCSGKTTYRFNDGCSAAEGSVDVKRSLLCHVKDSKEAISRIY